MSDIEPDSSIDVYRYSNSDLNSSHDYILPCVMGLLEQTRVPNARLRLFELGCGNGSVANALGLAGWDVTGVDPSTEGVAHARLNFPNLKIYVGSAYDELEQKFGLFPVVLSLEVVEHVFAPRDYARTLYNLLEPGGIAIISTPYHGYWKNLALALTGKMDKHFTALWDGGHIKFWSVSTLTELLKEAGFSDFQFQRVGRFPALAKSMIVTCKKR